MIEFPMPEVTQGSDQNAILTIAEIIHRGFIVTHRDRGYVMRVDGNARSDDLGEAESKANLMFAHVLGVLRAFKHGRGELAEEITRSPARDEHGNQFIRVGTAQAYMMLPGELETFAHRAVVGLGSSLTFTEALGLFGRPNRGGADYYSIYEYAHTEFGARSGITQFLKLSNERQVEFTKSVNHLRPAEGGRHASGNPEIASMSLDDISVFATDLMSAWISTFESE